MKSNIKSVNCNIPSAEYARMYTLSGDDITLQSIGTLITKSMYKGLHSFVLPYRISENNISYLRSIGYKVNMSSVYEDQTDPIVTISWK